MARSKSSRSGSSKRSSSSRTTKEPRKPSDSAKIRKLSRDLEKAQQQREKSSAREDEIRRQMTKMRDKCSHNRLAIDPETRNTYCRDCLAVVGIAPSQMADD
jgi:RNase P subunit RPR2